MTYWIQGGRYGNTLYYGEINAEAHGGKGELVTQNEFSPNSRFFYFFSGLHLCQLDTRYTDYNASEIDTFTLRATDGNCWLNFDEVEITRFPENLPLEIGGSWSVCPFVEEVDYWTENNNYSYNPVWLVEGGEIVSGQGADSIKVNWGETNFEAKVGVFSVNSFGCNSELCCTSFQMAKKPEELWKIICQNGTITTAQPCISPLKNSWNVQPLGWKPGELIR
jgi:hypothetical protein